MNSITVDNNEIKRIFNELSDLIIKARKNVEKAVNHELVFLYWNVGRYIKENVLSGGKAQYGKSVIEKLSVMLIESYGRGFSQRNLFRMVRFYDFYQKEEILPTVLAKLSWSHIIEILSVEDALKREFYLTMAINEGWSVRELNGRISSMLYERTAISKKPELTIYNDLKELREKNRMSSELFFRDPYVLDFLNLSDTYSEKDIENAIISELGRFILEMGNDFAFLARQKRITVDNNDYYMDLLFYHRKMKRLVVIELKLESFKPEHKGQVELYLRWLDRYERIDGEGTPLALILCLGKSDETVELLELDASGIHVGQFLTQLPPKEVFKEKLHAAALRARKMLEQKTPNEEI